jgi:tetratricopeptide (TPR) repeat protein
MNQYDLQNTESPEMLALMGYTLAKEAGQFRKGVELCLKSIALNPNNSDQYLHLGRIYLLANKKDLAIKSFRKGLKIRRDSRIVGELRRLGLRQSPTFNSLPRDHVVNRMTGKILHAMKLQ